MDLMAGQHTIFLVVGQVASNLRWVQVFGGDSRGRSDFGSFTYSRFEQIHNLNQMSCIILSQVWKNSNEVLA